MRVEILTEDAAWDALPEREFLARRAAEVVQALVPGLPEEAEVSILFADDDRLAALNRTFRNKSGPTNVLSFPAPAPVVGIPGVPRLLGDIVLAHGVVNAEAEGQGKALASHVSHLIVHGMLHLLGHHHDDDDAAAAMQALETAAQQQLGFPDPYKTGSARVDAGH
ncbi:MAG: rRNA maturation RNase YbeY [Parvibaculaceae bacterium]